MSNVIKFCNISHLFNSIRVSLFPTNTLCAVFFYINRKTILHKVVLLAIEYDYLYSVANGKAVFE